MRMTRRAKRVPNRQDGAETRQQLLEAAGEVFAVHGYAKATSKEICERAQANIAAVNYHFGGKDGLYAAVLEEAHSRLVSLQTLAEVARDTREPEARLRLLLTHLVQHTTQRNRDAWELRVLSRELLSHSSLIEPMVTHQVLPKAKFALATIAELMELPVEHPAVSRSLMNLIGPCLFMLVAPPMIQKRVLPNLDLQADALVDHLLTYALAGMQAVARQAKKAKRR